MRITLVYTAIKKPDSDKYHDMAKSIRLNDEQNKKLKPPEGMKVHSVLWEIPRRWDGLNELAYSNVDPGELEMIDDAVEYEVQAKKAEHREQEMNVLDAIDELEDLKEEYYYIVQLLDQNEISHPKIRMLLENRKKETDIAISEIEEKFRSMMMRN